MPDKHPLTTDALLVGGQAWIAPTSTGVSQEQSALKLAQCRRRKHFGALRLAAEQLKPGHYLLPAGPEMPHAQPLSVPVLFNRRFLRRRDGLCDLIRRFHNQYLLPT
jgi:hypothetical protein